MSWPRLKCLGKVLDILLLSSFTYAPLGQLALRIARPLLLAALSPKRCSISHRLLGFPSRRTTSTYSQLLNPYHIHAHRATSILSSTLSPQLAVSRIAVPLSMRYRSSAIPYYCDFTLLTLIAPMCDPTSQKSIISNW